MTPLIIPKAEPLEDVYEISNVSAVPKTIDFNSEVQSAETSGLSNEVSILPMPLSNLRNELEPAPLKITYFSCPLSDDKNQMPCKIYGNEQDVRKHLLVFHKISYDLQMKMPGMRIMKKVLE